MRTDNAELIQRILDGDEAAFACLVRKYQKRVHTLAWRKIGDFHIAEDITQETFLQVYRNLAKLKDPSQFPGWLYVIANRRCLAWLRKKRVQTQPLEEIDIAMTERSSYSRHVATEQAESAAETKRELVKNLLAKLKESDRTVLTLYYFGEMTYAEISEFLGVSVNTVATRVHRARERLKKYEPMIREALGSFQLSPNLTENIMREISHIKPLPPTGGKPPIVPWAIAASTVILIVMMLGISNQYLAHFQKPYSFEAQSEPTIEIVDVPIILDIAAKPAVRNQVGRATTPDKTSSAGTQASNVTSASTAPENSTKFSIAQWSQGNGPPSGPVCNIFATSDGTVYAVIQTGIYRLAADATAWTRVDASVPIGESLMPMAEHGGRLYIVAADEIFASDDRGETWNTLGPRPKGDTVGLVITDAQQKSSPQVPIKIYLALRDNGIFRSTEGGAQWVPLNNGLTDSEKISAVAAIEKTVFAGTENGLYRLDSNVWQKLSIDTSGAVCSLAVSANHLYAGIGHGLLVGLTPMEIHKVAQDNRLHFVKVFHSADLGASWTEIWHENQYLSKGSPAGITVLADGKTLLALSYAQSRSTDGGKTWTQLEDDRNFRGRSRLPAVMINEKTYYKANVRGIHRTTDGGESWHPFMSGVMGTTTIDLVAFNNNLYAHTGYEVYQSTDAGVSWKKLWNHGQEAVLNIPTTRLSHESKLIPVGEILYSLSSVADNLSIFRLSTDSDMLIPVQGVPIFDRRKIGYEKFYYKSEDLEYIRIFRLRTETAAASRDTFYVEYAGELYKWKLGDPEWTSTGLVDDDYQYDDYQYSYKKGFKLTVLGETVYVGKRNGKLFQSLDEGESWKDITSNLPLHFTRFKDMVFVRSTLYVATDSGVMASNTAEHWHVLTDSAGARPIINNFAVDRSKMYGIGDVGVYRLDTGSRWKQVSTNVPDEIVSLAITNDRLYSIVKGHGIFHTPLVSEER